MIDPVWADEVGSNLKLWYFWDEIWHEYFGPFETEEKAREELDKYFMLKFGVAFQYDEVVEGDEVDEQ